MFWFWPADEDKPMLSCYISKELVAGKKLNAGQVVRELGKYIQGGGGQLSCKTGSVKAVRSLSS
jgi:hypothetical protein